VRLSPPAFGEGTACGLPSLAALDSPLDPQHIASLDGGKVAVYAQGRCGTEGESGEARNAAVALCCVEVCCSWDMFMFHHPVELLHDRYLSEKYLSSVMYS